MYYNPHDNILFHRCIDAELYSVEYKSLMYALDQLGPVLVWEIYTFPRNQRDLHAPTLVLLFM